MGLPVAKKQSGASGSSSADQVAPVPSLHTVTTSLFLLAAFLAPGAWLVVRIPTLHKAQLCFVLATLLCVALLCLRLLPLRRPTRAAVLAAALAAGAFLLALATNAFPVQQFLYDLYGEMPGLLWLCYPVVFLLAASIGLGEWTRPALRAVTLVGLLLIVVALYQRFMTPWVNVFGSSAYNVSALIPIPVLALWLATVEERAKLLWRGAAVFAAGAVATISYGLLGIFALAALVFLIATLRPQLFGLSDEGRPCRAARLGGRVMLALLIAALVAALLPPVSGLFVKRSDLADLGSTIGSRMEFSYGAQAMVARRPLTGYGPAGYRFDAWRFLDSWLYGDTGTIGSDPIAYSPPSPHSLPWEVATRLGLIGLAALLAAGWFWLREATSANPDDAGAEVSGGLAGLRAACLIAALAWLLSLFVTPMHFASGLLGAALAGLACARPAAVGMEALFLPSAGKTLARLVGCGALVVLAILFTRQHLALAFAQTATTSVADDMALMQRVARVAAAHPLIERYLLQDRLMATTSAQDLNQQLQALQSAPGFVTDFTPNLVLFAQIALDRMQSLQTSDTAVLASVAQLLSQADREGLATPALLGEKLHLAVVSGDASALARARTAVRRPQFNGRTAEELYPPITGYLAR